LANTKASAFTADNTPTTGDGFPYIGDLAGTPANKVTTYAGLRTALLGNLVTKSVPWVTLGQAVAPDGTGTINNPATPELMVSSGTQTTNTPKLSILGWLFDQSTDEHLLWNGPLPADWSAGATANIYYWAKATTGNIIWKAGMAPLTASADDLEVALFLAGDLATADTVPGTQGHFKKVTIALTSTGLAAGDFVSFFVGRDADNGSDTLAADAVLVGVELAYTAA
jgi:hypothetical protein